jgi:prevent-host-death family protein
MIVRLDKLFGGSYNSYKKEIAMNVVGIRELKNQLTQYLRRAKKGEEVIVTERGKPIAVIRPTEGSLPARSIEAKLTELAGEGKIVLPRKKLLVKIPIIKIAGPPISATVLEERR